MLTHGLAQPSRDTDQQLVAPVVAELVVDPLEAVEVDEQDRDRVVLAGREGVGHVLLELGAVGQLGERVVQRLVGQLVVQGGQLGDVMHAHHQPAHAGVGALVADDQLARDVGAVGAADAGVQALAAAGHRGGGDHGRLDPGRVVGVGQLDRLRPEQVVRGEAEHARRRGADVDQPAGTVDDRDEVAGVGHQRLAALLPALAGPVGPVVQHDRQDGPGQQAAEQQQLGGVRLAACRGVEGVGRLLLQQGPAADRLGGVGDHPGLAVPFEVGEPGRGRPVGHRRRGWRRRADQRRVVRRDDRAGPVDDHVGHAAVAPQLGAVGLQVALGRAEERDQDRLGPGLVVEDGHGDGHDGRAVDEHHRRHAGVAAQQRRAQRGEAGVVRGRDPGRARHLGQRPAGEVGQHGRVVEQPTLPGPQLLEHGRVVLGRRRQLEVVQLGEVERLLLRELQVLLGQRGQRLLLGDGVVVQRRLGLRRGAVHEHETEQAEGQQQHEACRQRNPTTKRSHVVPLDLVGCSCRRCPRRRTEASSDTASGDRVVRRGGAVARSGLCHTGACAIPDRGGAVAVTEFVVGRNPDPGSRLPYLLLVPPASAAEVRAWALEQGLSVSDRVGSPPTWARPTRRRTGAARSDGHRGAPTGAGCCPSPCTPGSSGCRRCRDHGSSRSGWRRGWPTSGTPPSTGRSGRRWRCSPPAARAAGVGVGVGRGGPGLGAGAGPVGVRPASDPHRRALGLRGGAPGRRGVMHTAERRWRWLAPVLVYAGILGMSSLPGSRLEPLGLASWMAYVGHATEYGTLGAALAWAAAGTGWARRSRAATVGLVGLGAGRWTSCTSRRCRGARRRCWT